MSNVLGFKIYFAAAAAGLHSLPSAAVAEVVVGLFVAGPSTEGSDSASASCFAAVVAAEVDSCPFEACSHPDFPGSLAQGSGLAEACSHFETGPEASCPSG